MAILTLRKNTHTHTELCQVLKTDLQTNQHLAGTLASRHSYKRNFRASLYCWKLSCAPD